MVLLLSGLGVVQMALVALCESCERGHDCNGLLEIGGLRCDLALVYGSGW